MPVACFVSGTAIATPAGAALVEGLRAGDPVITASGAVRPIRWVGWRHLDLTLHPDPDQITPIRFVAGALEEGVPSRDLLVSPDHAMLIDGVLIPARFLVNGTTVRRERNARTVSYHHIELETHDILVAEAAPTESYLDTGNRGLFENADEPMLLHPDMARHEARREAGSCSVFASDAARVEPVWQRIAARARALGHAPAEAVATTSDPALRVEIGERSFAPVAFDRGCIVFLLPAWEGALHLRSRTTSRNHAKPWLEDRRRLGMMIRQLTISAPRNSTVIPVDHPMLASGWWGVERDGNTMWRWTDGNAIMSTASTTPFRLDVEIGETMLYPLDEELHESLVPRPCGIQARVAA